MSNLNDFQNMMEQYLVKNGYSLDLLSNIKEMSYNSESASYLCTSTVDALDMDVFAKKGYRKIILPESVSEDDSINTVDAFLIDKNNEWCFVEFKDAKIQGNIKSNILKKAYSNAYAIMDVLYDMRSTSMEYKQFNYDNPIEFFRKNVKYILVFSEKKNPTHVLQMKNHMYLKEHYLPEFMKRLQGYIYKEAYAVTETVFENDFLKKLCY